MKAKHVELGIGTSMLGSRQTLNATKDTSLEIQAMGIVAVGKSGRQILIPWANVRACELVVEQEPAAAQPAKLKKVA